MTRSWKLTTRAERLVAPKVLEFLCDEHGHFDAVVQPDDEDAAPCPECGAISPWSPTQLQGRVKRFEVARGKWEKPERKTWLDTRNLGEGQDLIDFRDDREAIREEQRKAEVMQLVKEG
jgi:hypothetical protein